MMEEDMRSRGGREKSPPWLVPFVETKFYGFCKTHRGICNSSHPNRNFCIKCTCNWYCIDCMGAAICHLCKQESHHGHSVLQVRKASNQWAIRVDDVKDLIDTGGLCKYTINHHFIFFLSRNSPEKNQKVAAVRNPVGYCEACGFTIDERGNRDGKTRFCSLICKSKETKNASSSEESQVTEERGKQPKSLAKRQGYPGSDGSDLVSPARRMDMSQPVCFSAFQVAVAKKTRRRKGIPCRSPLF